MMKQRSRFSLLLITFFTLGLMLAACQPQVVTVEVTRIVTEVEQVEVEVEGETVEVEVTRVVVEEVIVEQIELQATAAVETGRTENIEAIGSEEDGEESPFNPTPGPKVETTRATGWVDETAVVADEVRLDGGEVLAETAPLSAGDADLAAEPAELILADSEEPLPTRAADSAADVALAENHLLTAGDVNDNEKWDDYLSYRLNYQGPSIIEVDVTERHQIFVRNSAGDPILGAMLRIKSNGTEVALLRTQSDGRAYFFPRALPPANQSGVYEITAEFGGASTTFKLEAAGSTTAMGDRFG